MVINPYYDSLGLKNRPNDRWWAELFQSVSFGITGNAISAHIGM
jgi:hypothetical protein